MAEKKIVDVKRPEKVTPSASSRPIIVSSRPVLATDPMMIQKPEGEAPAEAVPITRTAKTIKPVSDDMQAPEESKEPAGAEEAAAQDAPASPEEPQETAEVEAEDTPAVRDSEAATSAAEAEADAAKQAREAELESLILSGKYAVPINAVSRKRTRMHVIFFSVLAVILALLLIDVLLDAGVVSAPDSVPHTHFFSVS